MRIKALLSLLTIALLLVGHPAQAERYRRTVDFEWEQIEGAKNYDLELTPVTEQKEGKPYRFKTPTAAWSGPLAPGIYKMRIRANDLRGVPGFWSPAEEVKVGLETVRMISPKPMEKVLSNSDEKKEVKFEWAPVGGAEKYQFSISSEDGEFTETETLKEPHFSVPILVAKNYNWKVKAVGSDTESDAESLGKFSLYGGPLSKPKIDKPEHAYVRNVAWEAPTHAQSYAYSLTRWNGKAKKWESVALEQDLKSPEIKFSDKWKGGKYKLKVKAKGNLRQASAITEVEFPVIEGNRSPAAQEIAITRESIDRFHGWYAVASYLITMVNYSGQNVDYNKNLDYAAVGGTGRLGAGYLSNETAWGFIGIADLGGMTLEGTKSYVFASLEANGIYRTKVGDKGELRQQLGLFYKELPETVGNSSDNIIANNTIATLGPHYGVEYWYALTSKLGFQLNAHLYPSMGKVRTPGGQPIKKTLSRQFGLLGSYRIQKNVTGLAGYAYRLDEFGYKASPGATSAAEEGDYNSAKIEGHYLNFFLEWAL